MVLMACCTSGFDLDDLSFMSSFFFSSMSTSSFSPSPSPSPPTLSISSKLTGGTKHSCLNLLMTSSLPMTISCEKNLSLQGLLAICTCFTFDLNPAVKKLGICGLGNILPIPGSFCPGTKMNFPSLAILGNLQMTFAKSSKYPAMVALPFSCTAEGYIAAKSPMKQNTGRGSNSSNPSKSFSNFSKTLASSKCTSDNMTKIPSSPCLSSCSCNFDNSARVGMAPNKSVCCKPIAAIASFLVSYSGCPIFLTKSTPSIISPSTNTMECSVINPSDRNSPCDKSMGICAVGSSR
mmetsp:Transcript_5210/g.7962  ORF Transcript_5210/g.7962 Transcript_5210/m.7962 type:complete len:292 (-) Transcript_5210:208-1083(-)